MSKKNWLICALICTILIFCINFIQNNYFTKHNVNVQISKIEETCTQLNTQCDTSLILKINSPVKNNNASITVDIKENVIILNTFQIILLCILAGIFIIMVYMNQKEKKEDISTSFWLLFIFGFLSIYQIFYLYTNNIVNIAVGGSFVILLGLTLYFALFSLIKLITKHNSDSILITILIMTILYNIKSLLSTYPYYSIFEVICIALLFIIFITLINTKKIIVFLKPFTIALIILCLLNSLFKVIATSNFAYNHLNWEHEFKLNKKPDRDIYIILLDMYAGNDTLKHLGFDNSKFLNTLEEKGFLVFDNVDSNYNKTLASVPSVLNFDYLDKLPFNNASEAISESAMFKIAKQLDYNIYYLNSWPLELSISNKLIQHVYNSDFYIGQASLSLFFTNTIFEPLINIFNKTNPIENALNYMDIVIKDNKTHKLVFAHFLMPHPPYLYDENGISINVQRDINIERSKYIQNTESYIGFLKYANNKTLNLVNKLLTTNKEKPIIILFGDHGIRKTYYIIDEKSHFTELTKDNWFLKAHFNTFIAYYNPDLDKQNYQNTYSLLNFFRKFANEVFGTDFTSLPDKKYYIYYDNSPILIHEIKGEFVK